MRPRSALRNLVLGMALGVIPGLMLFATVAQAETSAWTVEKLVTTIAVKKPASLRYTELKYLAALKAPLKQEGIVRFTPPDMLERSSNPPQSERFKVQGGRVEMQRGSTKPQQFDLAQYPPLQIFVSAFIGTLAGDAAQLKKNYELKLLGHEYAWKLELTPRDKVLSQRVKRIRVSGARSEVQQFETVQSNGDRSVLFFSLLPTP